LRGRFAGPFDPKPLVAVLAVGQAGTLGRLTGRPPAPEAVVCGRPRIEAPTGGDLEAVIDLLAEMLVADVRENMTVTSSTVVARSGSGGSR